MVWMELVPVRSSSTRSHRRGHERNLHSRLPSPLQLLLDHARLQESDRGRAGAPPRGVWMPTSTANNCTMTKTRNSDGTTRPLDLH